MTRPAARAFTLVELLIVIVVLAVLISVLLPFLSDVRKKSAQTAAVSAARRTEETYGANDAAPALKYSQNLRAPAGVAAGNGAGSTFQPPPTVPAARVKSFQAKVELTPRLSVGTADPESIYEVKFTANLQAGAPSDGKSTRPESCEIRLPLPPQIISLADLSVTVNSEPSDNIVMRDAMLVWTGTLPAQATPVQITYSAVGKGLFELQTPPGKILDAFILDLTANGSDLRMLDLSLQPTNVIRSAGQTTYSWSYQKLMFGRPIAVDVLGVAPVDRLGELRWLGPLSVVVFGLIVGLYAHAHALNRFDRWMLLLILGAFTGAYPLMYFAQEYVPLKWAIIGSAGLVTLIIGLRAATIIGLRHALAGVIMPAIGAMTVTLVVATHPGLQGLLLTAGGIVVFIVAMMLIPKLRFTLPPVPTMQPNLQPG